MAPGRAVSGRADPRESGALGVPLRALIRSAGEHANVARVRAHAATAGIDLRVIRFSASTRTANDAAREIGCGVERIVKSLVFKAGDETVVALCSGADRVDEARLASAIGASVARRATADEAKSATGYPIGGVPPFGHASSLRVVADRRLVSFETVWAAAGLPDTVFPIAPADLVRLGGATVADVAVTTPGD